MVVGTGPGGRPDRPGGSGSDLGCQWEGGRSFASGRVLECVFLEGALASGVILEKDCKDKTDDAFALRECNFVITHRIYVTIAPYAVHPSASSWH